MSCGCGCDCQQQLIEIQDQLSSLTAGNPLAGGFPIWMIDQPSDIAAFDSDSGLGSGIWSKWALCDGQSHTVATPTGNLTVQTPNLLDRFVVGAGAAYAVGATGGVNTVALSTAEMPAHLHGLTDPGHDHSITDPGHLHATSEDPHTHQATQPAHSHNVSLDEGEHTHDFQIKYRVIGDGGGGTDFNALEADQNSNLFNMNTGIPHGNADGAHTHSGETDTAQPVITVDPASTNIAVVSAATSITVNDATTGITMDSVGSGAAHENRPPYYALVYVKKIQP